MNIYIQNGVIQKPISLHAWKMMAACKGYCKTIKQYEKPAIEVVQEYLKTEFLENDCDLSHRNLYDFLLSAVFEICDENQIRNILLLDIPECFRLVAAFEKNLELSYNDLCTVLIKKLSLLKIKTTKEDQTVDLFIIAKDDGQLITMDEAKDEWLNEDIKKYKL